MTIGERAWLSGLTGMMGTIGAVGLLACGLSPEETAEPVDPRQAEVEHALSVPMRAPVSPPTTASEVAAPSVPLRDGFPWLADLIPVAEGSNQAGQLERLRRELDAAPDDLSAGHRLGSAHLSAAVHGAAHGHDAEHHLKQAAEVYGVMIDMPELARDDHADEVVFNLAIIALLRRDEARFKDNALLLIRAYPQSPNIPYMYLAYAEEMLEQGDVSGAIRLLEKTRSLGDAHARAFALHDLGTAHLQAQPADPRHALEAFVLAVEQTRLPDQPFPDSATALRTAARRDLVVPFAQVGNPAKARAFFKRVGRGPAQEDMVDEMLDLLAGVRAESKGENKGENKGESKGER